MDDLRLSPMPPPPAAAATLTKAILVALALAAVVLVTYILPANHGLDPLHVGAALGVSGPSNAPTDDRITFRTDAVSLDLAPNTTLRWGFAVHAGEPFTYAWENATAPLAPRIMIRPSSGADASEVLPAHHATVASNGTIQMPVTGRLVFEWAGPSDDTAGARPVTVTFLTEGRYSLLGAVRP